MARDTKQATARVQVESSINASGLVQAARETVSPIPRQNYNPQVNPDIALLTQALSNFVPTLAREAREQAERKAKTDFEAGQAARMVATEEQLNNPEAYRALNSEWFMAGYDHTAGQARATELGAQLEVEYDQIKDSLVTPGQYDKWMKGRLASALEGVDNHYFTQGFLEHMTRVDEKLRADSIANNYVKIQQSAMADLMTATKGSIVSKIEAGDKTWVEDLQVMRDKGRVDGIKHADINEMQFEILEEVAVDTGRPELMDEAFGHETPDTDNPERMIQPLASTPKWSGRIADVKARAEKVAAAKKTERDEVAKLGHFKRVQAEIDKGNFSKAEELADAGVTNKMYTAEKAMTFHAEIKKQRELARVRRDIGLAYDSGEYALAPRIPGHTDKLEEQVVSERSDNRWAAAGEDPIKQEQALERDIIEMNNSGVVIAKYKEQADYTASSPAQFQRAHALFKQMDSIAPGASHRIMDTAVAIQHDFYETMLDTGMAPEDALALTREAATPEKREAAARQMGFNRKDVEEEVASLLIDDAYTGIKVIDKDAMDTVYVQNRVYDLASQHIMLSGDHADPLKSIQWAAKHFKNTHLAVKIPGMDAAYWLETTNGGFPEEMQDAVEYFSEKLQKSFEGSPNYDEAGYYPVKLPDDSYAMHYASGPKAGLPVMGKNGPFRVEPRTIVAEYHNRGVKTPDELRADFKSEQAQRVEEQANTDKAMQRYRDQLEENRRKFEESKKKRKRP